MSIADVEGLIQHGGQAPLFDRQIEMKPRDIGAALGDFRQAVGAQKDHGQRLRHPAKVGDQLTPLGSHRFGADDQRQTIVRRALLVLTQFGQIVNSNGLEIQEAQQRIHGGAAAASQTTASGAAPALGTRPPTQRGLRPISLVLRGDRDTLLTLALRLAEETGVDAGRLQLLLLELRESIAARALEEHALRFPPNHPFWSQFPADGGRRVVVSLASMGYRFDGGSGWLDGRPPTIRELALALAHVGLDPRSLRRPAGQEAIDSLWQGTTVVVDEYLAGCAPALDLQEVIACLGSRAAPLSELWDMWGRLRLRLLTLPS